MLGRLVSLGAFLLLSVRCAVIFSSIFGATGGMSAKISISSLILIPFGVIFVFVIRWIREGWNSDSYAPVLIGSVFLHVWALVIFGFV